MLIASTQIPFFLVLPGLVLAIGIAFLPALATAAKFAPAALQIGSAIFGKKRKVKPVQLSRASLAPLQGLRTDFDINPALERNRTALRTITADPNASIAQKLIAHTNNIRSSNELFTRKQNVEADLTNRKLAAISDRTFQLDSAQAQLNQGAQVANQQNQAQRFNLLQSGLGNLAIRSSGLLAERNQARLEPLRLASALTGITDQTVRGNFIDTLLDSTSDAGIREILEGLR